MSMQRSCLMACWGSCETVQLRTSPWAYWELSGNPQLSVSLWACWGPCGGLQLTVPSPQGWLAGRAGSLWACTHRQASPRDPWLACGRWPAIAAVWLFWVQMPEAVLEALAAQATCGRCAWEAWMGSGEEQGAPAEAWLQASTLHDRQAGVNACEHGSESGRRMGGENAEHGA